MEENILGFDPSQLTVFAPVEQTNKSFNQNIYKPHPRDSKSDDGVYRAQIKVIYNPHSFCDSIIQRQSYAMNDDRGFFMLTSKLTDNDTNCPIFKAWKACYYSKDPKLQAQALTKEKGGLGLFDKRFERFVTIQVIEDNNHPEYVGKYMIWKMPKYIWDAINNKMKPAGDSKKAAIPVMDFLFGRAIDLEITPGPDDPSNPERKNREISYTTSEITDDVVSCTYPDGSPLLDDEQQEILEKYISRMSKEVWKQKDPELRKAAIDSINKDPNTITFNKFYNEIVNKIKDFCPNVKEEMGYHEWTPEENERAQRWISNVLACQDPTTPPQLNVALGFASAPAAPATPVAAPVQSVATEETDDDLPF